MFRLLNRALLIAGILTCQACQVSIPKWETLTSDRSTMNATRTPSAVHKLLDEEKLNDAERLLRKTISQRPESITDRTNLAIVLARTGQTEAAAQELTTILSRRPDYCPALMQQAELALARFDIKAAEHAYRICLSSTPAYRPALLNLGILLEIYRGELDEALQHYERYQQLSASPNRQVSSWITDLNRRVAAAAADHRSEIAEVRR